MRDYPGYNRFHPHSDEAVRGHEREGLRHIITRHGSPAAGYRAESVEANKRHAADNKIKGLPPHQMERYGVSEDSKGVGAARNDYPDGNRFVRHGGMPKHGDVKTRGTR